MSFKSIYISLITIAILLSGLSIQQDKGDDTYILITESKVFTADDNIELEFRFKGSTDVVLYCSNSYGSVILKPRIDSNLKFTIPKSISNKSGLLNWQLQSDSDKVSGQLKILPKTKIKTIETYIGPPSIEAGGKDYTMLVVIPTDDLDNPLIDSTKVSVKHQFLDNQTSNDIHTQHGFGYKNLSSYEKSGRIIISSECLGLNSKEYDVNVMPAIPTNFNIYSNRIHNYADGNQITTFKTSVIKDRFDNVVSDGTFVSFFITDKNGNKATTQGTTINGVATAKMLHPDHEDQWTIKAYIEGMANSDTLVLNYKQAVSNFDVSFSKNNRTINVGPLQSFMNQRVPDGLDVILKIYRNDNLENQISKQSKDGFANFKLNLDRYPKGRYNFEIEVAGLTKSFTNITYE